ncbi:MAG: DNA polymerase III subunit gamma/tau [Bdellovibrionales bacterium]|nr:DNA polymerase III subunit gamma/tau [Bdellovibrionales bacterium]
MSYLVFARKYRPDSFQAVSGQDHVTTSLRNALSLNRIGHAYLFSGPRGVGKTSVARIFAKCLNCSEGPTPTPCLECTNCKEIASGVSLAVREIDGASHNSVDNVRELIDSFRSLPPPGTKYKVYIIDEVHMLSLSAFNALLKSLEEPPPHTVFILATTELHKIPETVLSRCQRFDFRALPSMKVEERLMEIAQAEGFSIDFDALRLIARLAEGSMRDAQTLLDRVHAFSGGNISGEVAAEALGTVDRKVLVDLLSSVFQRDIDLALASVEKAFQRGAETSLFIREFIGVLRDCLFVGSVKEDRLLANGMSQDEIQTLRSLVAGVDRADLTDMYRVALQYADSALRSSFARYSFEALIVQLSSREPVKELGELLSKVKLLLQSPRRERGVPSASAARSVRKDAAPLNPRSEPEQSVSDVTIELGKWDTFVQFVATEFSPVLGEHLRRVGVARFGPGSLTLSGPKFHLDSIESQEGRSKLVEALERFFKVQEWEITFVPQADKDSEVVSLHSETQRKRREQKVAKREEVLSHPQVRAIREAFPGTSVESIRTTSEQGE